jgi:hypothetical protein
VRNEKIKFVDVILFFIEKNIDLVNNISMETRVEKYKVYRASLIKIESEKHVSSAKYETKTLPISEVMSGVQDNSDAKYFKKERNKKAFMFTLGCLMGLAVIAGLVIFGIYVFGGIK